MKKILPLIIILVAGLLGGGGGYFFKTSSAPSDSKESVEKEHGGSEKKKKKKKGKGHDSPEGESEAVSYMKFSRQFVVPVVRNGTPQVMMIFSITIAVEPSLSENAYLYEPRLRDAILATLLQLGSRGELTVITESTEMMASAKSALLDTAKSIIGDGAREVLILDIGVQKY